MASPQVIPRAGRIANNLVLYDVKPTGDEIGRGAYGRVFAVNYEGTICAAKEVHTLLLEMSQDEALHKIKSDFLSECQIWSTLRHPCVVQFLGMSCTCFKVTYLYHIRPPQGCTIQHQTSTGYQLW